MGTHSITYVYDAEETDAAAKPLLSIYQQYDGYPSGVGADLCKFMTGFVIVNGIDSREGKIANGAGCFAAQLVKHLKKDVGGVYIYPPGCDAEEFVYKIYIVEPKPGDKCGRIHLEVWDEDGKQPLFSGYPADVAHAIDKAKKD